MEIDPIKLVFVAIAALVLLGPERLPQIAKRAGELLSTLRAQRDSLTSQISSATNLPNTAVGGFLGETLKTASTVTSLFGPTGAVGSVLQPSRMVNSVLQPQTSSSPSPATSESRQLTGSSPTTQTASSPRGAELSVSPGYTLGSPDLN
ncbi:MAG: Sec-independent protein translocase subunit TatA/TatB [Ferrimicrobium sp.]|jgi:sec-independent protein translocase protein TatB|uniref:Twin-arginine translocase TatA/TatE family subunit n=1 Tax=Ferrimicrobium acidiphilum TaxID=121039 RepID=A0ABV3Y0S6_9ACTN|nr:twin-arginine translocase TatA/TatE family subunit [Ferrimicrobium sp.]